jgi:hypothetical protein
MRGSCLCGELRWEAGGGFELASHCHCSRCRKLHGSAYATYALTKARGFSLEGAPARFESAPGAVRRFCPRCGSVAPGDAAGGRHPIPLGGLDGDPGVRPLAHIFVGSKAPWFELHDRLPRFDTLPPGVAANVLPDRPALDPPGGIRGSCVCGRVGFVIDAPPQIARFCHCSRCRKARAAAHAANLFVAAPALRFTRGASEVVTYKIPEALRFAQSFCRTCGGKLPRVDPERQAAIVPMGALDDDPGLRPQAHIFVASKAPWDEIHDDLPQHAEYAPA